MSHIDSFFYALLTAIETIIFFFFSGIGQRTASGRNPVPVGEPNVAQRRGGEQRTRLAVDGPLSLSVPADRATVQIPVKVTTYYNIF